MDDDAVNVKGAKDWGFIRLTCILIHKAFLIANNTLDLRANHAYSASHGIDDPARASGITEGTGTEGKRDE